MKRRIEQLLNGIFEYERPALIFTPETLLAEVVKDGIWHGSFRIESEDHRKVKGFLYTSSPRVICDPVEFQGMENEIHCQIDCSGLEEGTTEQGTIAVCSDLGEYTIPYTIEVKRQSRETESPFFTELAGFAKLAREDFQRAYRDFISPGFRNTIEKREPSLLGLYDSLRIPEVSYHSLEEFLIGAGCKEPVEISVSQTRLELSALSEPVQKTVTLEKNTWGFQKIEIESDSRFLRPEKKVITTEEFVGSTFDLNLVVDTNLMHGGMNYARVRLSAGSQTIDILVEARRNENPEKRKQNRIRKIMMKELEGLYVSFRLKKTDLSTWVERSVSVINSYRRAGGTDPFAELFLVQLYFADGKKQKAYKLLESLENQKNRLNTPERYGFYLYMTTFFYHEASYVDQVEAEISRMFCQDRTNWKLQWILLYLQESLLKDDNAKYEAVAEQFRYGCRSRIMYLEAYQILKKNPFLMRHLGSYELQLLRFAARESVLTAEIIRQAAGLAMHHRKFDRQLFWVLSEGYQLYPSEDLVKAICTLLMKGDKKESCYFPWYEKGVDGGLRITGLYEYYMETMDELDIQKLPQVIRMYFGYDSTLDYRKRAAIYRKIVENREMDGQTFRNYRAAMEKFTMDQLELMRISDDLAVLYRTFLRKNVLTRNMAEKLIRILFTYQVTCSDKKAGKLVIHSDRMKQEQTVVLQGGKGFIQIYDPDSALTVEDDGGSRYLASTRCSLAKALEDEKLLSWAVEKTSDHEGLVLFVCSQCLKAGLVNRKTLPYFRTACEMRDLSDGFRREIRREVLQYYVSHLREESLPQFLEEISYEEYVRVDKTSLITLLAEEGKCTEAFRLLDDFGAEGIPLLQMVRICSRMVLELEFGENTMLVALCYYCFESGKYDDKLLRYLLLYYEGPVQKMIQVWQAAVRFDLDTMLLEEKIMMMLLFTRSGTQGSEPVFESYLKKMGRKKLCRAYVNLKAYEYFVKGLPVAESVFQYIEREYQYLSSKGRLDEQEEVCRLALLQHYAKAVELTAEQRKRTEEMLEEFGVKGIRFAFWQCFDGRLLAPHQMEGRVFVEYACSPDSKVTIHYRIRGREENYVTENVQNYFEGIFVREFTLFYGEELECYLEEEKDGETKKTDKRVLKAQGASLEKTSGYELLNQICKAWKKKDEAEIKEGLESYLTLEHLAKEVFTLV